MNGVPWLLCVIFLIFAISEYKYAERRIKELENQLDEEKNKKIRPEVYVFVKTLR